MPLVYFSRRMTSAVSSLWRVLAVLPLSPFDPGLERGARFALCGVVAPLSFPRGRAGPHFLWGGTSRRPRGPVRPLRWVRLETSVHPQVGACCRRPRSSRALRHETSVFKIPLVFWDDAECSGDTGRRPVLEYVGAIDRTRIGQWKRPLLLSNIP